MRKHILSSAPLDIAKLFSPLFLFPLAYFPYKLWGIAAFAGLVRLVVYGEAGNPMWTAFNAQETVIYFWLVISALVILACAVLAALRVRPWYFIPLYLLVTVSVCGILALAFYRLMV